MKKIALIGAGGVVSGKHREAYEALRKQIQPWVVCDPSADASLSTRIWAEIPDSRYVKSLDDLDAFKDEIDFAVVATPVKYHAASAMHAMQLGWDVLCEKPLALDLEELDLMIHCARRHGRRLGVGHNIRYAGIVHDTCAYIQSGNIGDVRLVQGHAQAQPWSGNEWRTDASQGGAGHFFDCLYHEIYCARAVINSPIKRIHAVKANLGKVPISVEDVMLCTMEFENGALASFQDVKAFPENAPALFATYGTEGAVIRQIPASSDLYVMKGHEKSPLPAHSESTEHGTAGVFQRFVQAIDAGQPLPYEINADGDGRENLRVVLAAYESARTGLPIEMRHWQPFKELVTQ